MGSRPTGCRPPPGFSGAWLTATRRSGYSLGVARARQPRRPEASFGLAAGGDESGWRLPHRVASRVGERVVAAAIVFQHGECLCSQHTVSAGVLLQAASLPIIVAYPGMFSLY